MQTELFNDDCGKGTKSWGMPWMGSKSDIAWQVVNAIPKGETFVDLFFGGGAITHAAMVSKRWDNFIANDILGTPDIFIKAVRGELKGYDRFVSRSEFKASDDIVVKMLWSFGNDLKSYLWSPENERLKGIATQMLTAKTLESRRMYFKNFIGALKKKTSKTSTVLSGSKGSNVCNLCKDWQGSKVCNLCKDWKCSNDSKG